MSKIPEELFNSLNIANAVHALIGKTEDLHLDCKVWPSKDDDAQKMLAKSACGFANADGGVIVVGMKAKSLPAKDEPDQIQAAEPVSDTGKIKPRIQDLIGQLVEPSIVGVRVTEVNDPVGSKSGFLIVLVPSTDGLPCRSRKDWKFYQRISSGTYPMEYFQIADMFGRRRRPILNLYVDEKFDANSNQLWRICEIGITNLGRAVAKYPGLRFRLPKGGITVQGYRGQFRLPFLYTDDPGWITCGGGINDVIYPGATMRVLTLSQPSHEENLPFPRRVLSRWNLSVELSAEDMETITVERTFNEHFQS